jgi:hypothetical protein
MPASFTVWTSSAPLWLLGLIIFALPASAFFVGHWLRLRAEKSGSPAQEKNDFDGYIVSAVFGLVALLLGFTFSLAIQRFEQRRQLVLEEANAIETAYLRVQILASPHRERLSALLRDHIANELALSAVGFPDSGALRERGDKTMQDIWSATVAALDVPRAASMSLMLAAPINSVLDIASDRTASREARIPIRVFMTLWIYLSCTGGVLGRVMGTGRGGLIACFMLALMTLSLVLVIDIDRPSSGRIQESQKPLEDARDRMAHTPPGSYDVWRKPSP